MFHTALWDHEYTTGGNRREYLELTKLRDKRVAIVGNRGDQPVQCSAPSCQVLQTALRPSAYSVEHRPAGQSPDRSGLGQVAPARLAG